MITDLATTLDSLEQLPVSVHSEGMTTLSYFYPLKELLSRRNMANFLQFMSFAAFVTAIKMDCFVFRVRFGSFFFQVPGSDLLFVSIVYVYICMVLMYLSMCHSSVVVKCRNSGKVMVARAIWCSL